MVTSSKMLSSLAKAKTEPRMAKAGFWLNIIGVVLVTMMLYAIIPPLLGGLVQ